MHDNTPTQGTGNGTAPPAVTSTHRTADPTYVPPSPVKLERKPNPPVSRPRASRGDSIAGLTPMARALFAAIDQHDVEKVRASLDEWKTAGQKSEHLSEEGCDVSDGTGREAPFNLHREGQEGLAGAFRCRNSEGDTALHLCTRGPATLQESTPAAEGRGAGILSLLLRAKGNANTRNRYGETPLLVATRSDYWQPMAIVRLARILLESGADPGVPDALVGETPLMEAAGRGNAFLSCLLVGARANVAQRSRYKKSAVDFANTMGHRRMIPLLSHCREEVVQQDVAQKLTSLLPSLESAVRAENCDEAREVLQKMGPRVAKQALAERDSKGQTMLHRAAGQLPAQVEMVQLLLEFSANLTLPDALGRLPLTIAKTVAAEAGESGDAREEASIVQALLLARASPELEDTMLAAAAGKPLPLKADVTCHGVP